MFAIPRISARRMSTDPKKPRPDFHGWFSLARRMLAPTSSAPRFPNEEKIKRRSPLPDWSPLFRALIRAATRFLNPSKALMTRKIPGK